MGVEGCSIAGSMIEEYLIINTPDDFHPVIKSFEIQNKDYYIVPVKGDGMCGWYAVVLGLLDELSGKQSDIHRRVFDEQRYERITVSRHLDDKDVRTTLRQAKHNLAQINRSTPSDADFELMHPIIHCIQLLLADFITEKAVDKVPAESKEQFIEALIESSRSYEGWLAETHMELLADMLDIAILVLMDSAYEGFQYFSKEFRSCAKNRPLVIMAESDIHFTAIIDKESGVHGPA